MNQHKFFPVQEPQPEEFDEAFVDTSVNLFRRLGVITHPGILPAAALYTVTGDSRYQQMGEFAMTTITGATGDNAFILNIGPGLAFSRNPVNDPNETPYQPENPTDLKMERIWINPTVQTPYNADSVSNVDVLGNLLPQSTGSYGIPLNPRSYLPDGPRAASKTYYIYVAYLSVVDTLTAGGGDPVNKYSINPHSGEIGYTHWVDGYQIKIYDGAASTHTNTSDVLLGIVKCTDTGIVSIDTSGRDYLYIPAPLVKAQLGSAALTTSYSYESLIQLADHVNAVDDPTLVSATNPHGQRQQGLTGATAAGPYVQTPENFHTNGIVDVSAAAPGPWFCRDTAAPSGLWRTAKLAIPTSSQALYVYGKLYTANSHYWSQVYDGVSALAMQEIFENNNDPILRADFAYGQRTAGIYVVYGEYYVPADPTHSGLAVKAVKVTGTLSDIVANPASFLPSPALQYPFAVCQWDGSNFVVLNDPDTGYTNTDYKMIDVRNYGTISSSQLVYNKRCYPSDSTAHLDVVGINHDVNIVKSLTVGHTLAVGGTLAAAHIVGDGSGLTNLPVRASGQASSSNIAYTTNMSWSDIPGYSVSVTTHGGPLALSWNGSAATAAGRRVCFRFVVDGVPVTSCELGNAAMTAASSSVYQNVAANWLAGVSTGSHTVKMQWRTTTATTTIYLNEYGLGPESTLLVQEV